MTRWTDDELTAAVAATSSLFQTLTRLGLRPRGANYATVRRRIEELDLPTDHWPRRAYLVVDVDRLRATVAASTSVSAAIRSLDWPVTTSTRRRFRRLIEVYGLDISHFLGQASNRGRKFPGRARPLEARLTMGPATISSSDLRRRLVAEGVLAAACAVCARKRWEQAPIPLELDHVNGDRNDNRLHNLRLLCPNCHALTPTYRGCNVGRYVRVPA